MTVRDIVGLFLSKKIPGNIIYRIRIDDTIAKFEVLSVYEPTHHAFIVDKSTKLAQTIADPIGEFFLTPKECVEYRIKCVKENIERSKKELEYLERKYGYGK